MPDLIMATSEFLDARDMARFATTHWHATLIMGTQRCRTQRDYVDLPWLLVTQEKTWAVTEHDLESAKETLHKRQTPFTVVRNTGYVS